MTLSGKAILEAKEKTLRVLIPLLVDDPLRAKKIKIEVALNARLNPSFSG